MTKDEALKLALEYIETNAHERRHVRWAIKEALAQPEQEPTWWLVEYHDWAREFVTEKPEESIAIKKATPLYTTPPAAQPEERNFCPRCGKRTADPTTIHTCTPPRENT
jgi:hypothetical protein